MSAAAVCSQFVMDTGCTMVQELPYDACSMFPQTRHSPYSMNHLSQFGYPTQQAYQQTEYVGQYGQMAQESPVAAQQAGSSPPTSWAMYSPPSAAGPARASNTSMEECWYPSQLGGGTSHPGITQPAHSGTPYSLPRQNPASHSPGEMGVYGQSSSHSPLPLTPQGAGMAVGGSLSGPSPSPPGIPSSAAHHRLGSTAMAATSRPNKEPFEWINRKAYPTTSQMTGKTRTKDKYRIVYSEYQKVELEKEYLYSKYITIQRKAELARSIGLSERQVKIWFQNRRAKERKHKRKREEAIAVAAQSTTDLGQDHKDVVPSDHMSLQVHIKAESAPSDMSQHPVTHMHQQVHHAQPH